MGNDDKPCCPAGALRRIRQVTINGRPTGIVMLDEIISEVRVRGLYNDLEIRAALLERAKIYNYVPPTIEEQYGRALLEEYQKSFTKE